ncbi:hypothetical protein DR996_31355 [Vibrio owensii]|nr:hypothetical protein DR996_31355 [Vibrio owensii]
MLKSTSVEVGFLFSLSISEFAASRFLVSPRFAGMTDLRKLGASIRIHNVILESDEGVSRDSQVRTQIMLVVQKQQPHLTSPWLQL